MIGFESNDFVEVKVKPNSNECRVISYDPNLNILFLAVKSEPIEGKANKEILKFLKKQTKYDYEIVSGINSRKKLLKKI